MHAIDTPPSLRLRLIAACCIATLVVTASAQSDTPATSAPVIRVSTQVVAEEVSVTDAHGNPVHGMKADQFTVTEDGKRQSLRHFEEHSTIDEEQAAVLQPAPKLDPGVFTNYTPAPEIGAVNVLLLDSLNTPMESQSYVKAQLQDYVKSLKPGTRIAIFNMSRELHLLQGFTSDPEKLKAVLNNKTAAYRPSQLMNNAVSGDMGADTSESDAYFNAVGNDPSLAQALAGIQQFEAEQQSFQLQVRAQYTLDAMNQLARYLAGIPGRKNLIWFSASFPIDLLPDGELDDPFATMGDSEDEFRETVTLMARSHVAVFPVDARGLMVNPLMNAENTGMKYTDSKRGKKDTQTFFNQTSDEHNTMLQIAEKTGGHAFLNSNGLKEAVQKAIDAGSNYYSLSYYPTGHKWDGKYHTVSIKLTDPKLKLTYRVGYYADDPDGPPNRKDAPLLKSTQTAVADKGLDPHSTAMRAAMQFGAPQPTQIVMKVRVQKASDTPEEKAALGNTPDPKLAKGPYLRYGIDFTTDARHVQFTPNPDGTSRVTLNFAVLVYDDQGNLYNALTRTASADADAAKRASMMKVGMHAHLDISVPEKGHYYLRIGIRDAVSDGMGAVEINLDNVNRISAAAAAAAPPKQ